VDPVIAAIRSQMWEALKTAAASSPDPAVKAAAQDAVASLQPTLARVQAVRDLFIGGTSAEKVRAVNVIARMLANGVGGS